MENSEILGLPELAFFNDTATTEIYTASYTYPSRAFRG